MKGLRISLIVPLLVALASPVQAEPNEPYAGEAQPLCTPDGYASSYLLDRYPVRSGSVFHATFGGGPQIEFRFLDAALLPAARWIITDGVEELWQIVPEGAAYLTVCTTPDRKEPDLDNHTRTWTYQDGFTVDDRPA